MAFFQRTIYAFTITLLLIISLYFWSSSEPPCNSFNDCLLPIQESYVSDNSSITYNMNNPSITYNMNNLEESNNDTQNEINIVDSKNITNAGNNYDTQNETNIVDSKNITNAGNNYDTQNETNIVDSKNITNAGKEIDEDTKQFTGKYLTYFPHSGFNNQRIEVTNALILAALLNRTLIMPPVITGHPWSWRNFDGTQDLHTKNLEKIKKHCQEFHSPDGKNIPNDCKIVADLSYLPWDELFDFRELGKKVPYINRVGLDIKWIENAMGIKPEETTYWKNETSVYNHLFWEASHGHPPDVKSSLYSTLVSIKDLRKDPARLIHLGSVFGTGRVRLSNSDTRKLRSWIRRQFIFSHPAVLQTANLVISQLGGPKAYISMHARVGDGAFKQRASHVLSTLYDAFSQKHRPLSNVTTLSVEQCLSNKTEKKFPLIFMATDANIPPRNNSLFKSFFTSYPCILTLSDLLNFSTSPLVNVTNPHDGQNIGKTFIPFVDGLVAAHASDFTGSVWSTFSGWLEDMNKWMTK